MERNHNEIPVLNLDSVHSDQNEPNIVQTDIGAIDGQNKCPKCGATEISLNVNTGRLRCHYCRHEFTEERASGLDDDISRLHGEIIGSGATDIIVDTHDIVTFKCGSCGSEVVIDTSEVLLARCHWCRNTLSVNQQVPNGSVPDMVLPFQVAKDVARTQIERFVKKRNFFAHPQFKKEFTTENIMGVYLPYMIVDINGHAKLVGQGEHLIRKYTRGSGNSSRTYYDADLYDVSREFDIMIDNLTIESSLDKLQHKNKSKTTNIINSIMPFDIENCVKWNANYLKGYTSEKRDTDIEQLREMVNVQAKDVVRHKANGTLNQYDRGVKWSTEQMTVKGQKWNSSYLPIWLYSYQQTGKNGKNLLHYVAVNARTKETMGSVPIHMPKLLFASFLMELVGLVCYLFSNFEYHELFLSLGVIYYFIYYFKYRNSGARHAHEAETDSKVANVQKEDKFVKRRTGLNNPRMEGANNLSASGKSNLHQFYDMTTSTSQISTFLNSGTSIKKDK